jgi:hypothetical protein
MIEKLLVSTPLLVLLWIFATAALQPSKTTYPILTKEQSIQMSSRSRKKRNRARTINNLDGVSQMSPKVVNITCKRCDKTFTRLEWMTNKICDNPNCNCPEVRKTMEQANAVIDKAKQSSRINSIKVTTETMPTKRNDRVDQLEIDVPPVTVVEITPVKRK